MSEQQKAIDSYGMKDLGWDKVPFDIGDKKMETLISLKGKKAIVTGAGGVGLGLAISHRLASLGADVMMTDINPRVNDTAKEVAEKWGVNTYPLISDFTKYDEVQKMMAEAKEKMGRIDILINNAFFTRYGLFKDFTPEMIDTSVTGGLVGLTYCCRAVCDYMIPQGSGRIINITSASSMSAKTNTGITLYGALKSAVNGLTRGLANELAPHGITVNAVSPGLMLHTELQEAFKHPTPENLAGRIPMVLGVQSTLVGRTSIPEEVANVVGFMCSDACSYMYGQVVNVDGGIIV